MENGSGRDVGAQVEVAPTARRARLHVPQAVPGGLAIDGGADAVIDDAHVQLVAEDHLDVHPSGVRDGRRC